MIYIPSRMASVIALVLLVACETEAPTMPHVGPLPAEMSAAERGRYVVVFAAERIPSDFQERVVALGGSVESALHDIGVVGVTGLTATAAAALSTEKDVGAVERDVVVRSHDIPHAEGSV